MTEGRYDCNVAQLLLYEWTQRYAATDNDCLHDFFRQLLHDIHNEQQGTESTTEQEHDRLPHAFLAKFIQTRCALNFHVEGTTAVEIRTELAERIGEELAMVHAYTRLWRGNATYLEPSATLVQCKLEEKMDQISHPWPPIAQQPTPQVDDGRLAKSFPIEFPMGQGDLRQPRLRGDFSPEEWGRIFSGTLMDASSATLVDTE